MTKYNYKDMLYGLAKFILKVYKAGDKKDRPQEGQTKPVAVGGTLRFSNSRWRKQENGKSSEKISPKERKWI